MRLVVTCIVALGSLLAVGCSIGGTTTKAPSSAGPTTTPAIQRAPGEPKDLAGLRAALLDAGLEVGSYRDHRLGVQRPSLLPKTHRYQLLRVAREQTKALSVFRFVSRHDAARAAAMVDSSGGLPTVEFIGPPHFFRRGRVIVLYVESGSPVDATVMEVLHEVLGDPLP